MGILSVDEVAERLDITAGRVRQMIAHGRIPARKVSGVWLVSEADFDALEIVDRRSVPDVGEDEQDEWVTSSDAARIMGLSRTRITQLQNEGKLPSKRVGSLRIIARADLEALMEERRKYGVHPGGPRPKRNTSATA